MCQYVNMPIGLRRPKKQAAAQLAYWHISILEHYSLFRSRIKCTDAKRQPAELYPAECCLRNTFRHDLSLREDFDCLRQIVVGIVVF